MADYDLKITGGVIHSGEGEAPVTGDIGIKAGRIIAVGDAPGEAAETIDAAGCIVTPGFVDIHTHYDGQATWGEAISPSSLHGCTTVIMGNCGVGFAPCRPEDHDRLIRLMEGVEDIPGTALAEGLTWDWESFPDYLDALEKRRAPSISRPWSATTRCGFIVMDERASFDAQAANDEEIANHAPAGLRSAGCGRHRLRHRPLGSAPHGGRGMDPGVEATAKELTGIASAFKGRRSWRHPGGLRL
jgi:N-acyl-D-aspartate/D-glutamate deacylase